MIRVRRATTRIRRGRLWSLLLGVSITSALPAQRVPRDRAWLFTWTVTGAVAGTARDTGESVVDVAIWRGVARLTVRRGALRALTGERGVLLLLASDSTITLVNPVRQEALVAQSTEFNSLLGGAIGSMQFDVSDVASRTTARGAGPRLLGFATRRVELAQHYSLQVGTGTVRRSLRTEQLHQLDVSRDVATLDPGFRAFSEHFARSLGVPAVVRSSLRALERDVPAGFLMQSHTTSITVVGSDTLRTETRSAVSTFRTDAVDTTTFAVPRGYRITEMSRLLHSRTRPGGVPPPPP